VGGGFRREIRRGRTREIRRERRFDRRLRERGLRS
jgi:hypothetical protein